MKIEVKFHDPETSRKLDRLFDALTLGVETIMSAISDYAAKQTAFNTQIASDLAAVAAKVTSLNDTIAALQNSAGQVTPEDQALIDKLQTDGAALQNSADALAGTAPVPIPPVVANG